MQETPSPSLSGRALLSLGLETGAVLIGSGGVWYLSARRSAAPSGPPTPAPPAGTTLVTYTGHTAPVFSAAWSPDGRRIASGSYDDRAQVWDSRNGQNPLVTYTGHSLAVSSVAWSPNNRLIASASYDDTVQVWQAV